MRVEEIVGMDNEKSKREVERRMREGEKRREVVRLEGEAEAKNKGGEIESEGDDVRERENRGRKGGG